MIWYIIQLGTTRRVIDFVNSSTRILDLYSNLDLDQATYAAILTTETIVWFDPAHDGRIMLSWKHYLPVSDGLRLKVLPAAKRKLRIISMDGYGPTHTVLSYLHQI